MTTPTYQNARTMAGAAVGSVQALAAAYENGGSGTFGADCTDWLLEDLDMDTNGGGELTVRGFTASAAGNDVTLLVNGTATGLNASWDYTTMVDGGAPNPSGTANPPVANCNGDGGLDLCQFTWRVSIDNPHSSLQRRRFSFDLEFASNPTTGLWYHKKGYLYLNGGAEIVSLGLHSTVTNGLAAESTYSYISRGR